ncbi:methyltransferase [Roseiconus lacunae]|uniref:methyltransferase n=1 Tax=Roseiconus lacunae TaxID=2605694 RepID=UPI0011F3F273|nr:methyltransferase [Roseiconus lacunae]
MLNTSTLKPLSSEDAKLVRDTFRDAEYTESRLRERSGLLVPPPAELTPGGVVEAFQDSDSAFDCLAQLFFLGREIDVVAARKVLPKGLIDCFLRSGVIAERYQSLTPKVLLVPVEDVWLASDLQVLRDHSHKDYVPTVCDAALHLASVAVRQPTRRMLDLCCGFSLHGVLASRHAESVITSDLNPRAAAFARFNAALNECQDFTTVTGDVFSAVKGKKFDLILSNPPFIISPEAVTTYRFAPYELDGFVEQMFRQAPDYLQHGGIFQAVCEWVEIDGVDWQQRLQTWFEGRGCDVWVLTANRQLPSTYAANTLRQSDTDADQLPDMIANWEQYFSKQKVNAIHGGFIFLRRRDGDNWFDVSQLTKPIRSQIGDAIVRGLDNRDLLYGRYADQDILNSRLAVTRGIRIVEDSIYNGIRWESETMTLHVDCGIPVSIGIDKYVRNLIARYDGQRIVSDCLADFANHVGLPMDTGVAQGLEITKAMIRTGVLGIVKESLENRILASRVGLTGTPSQNSFSN